MTDRHVGYVVTLEHDMREDDAEGTLTALRQIKGVLDVRPLVGSAETILAYERARNHFFTALMKTIRG